MSKYHRAQILTFLLSSLFSLSMCKAQVTMTFNNYGQAGNSFYWAGQTPTENGFVLGCAEGFYVWGNSASYFAVSPSVFVNSSDKTVCLARTNTQRFDLLSMKLSKFTLTQSDFVRFYGYRGSDLVVSNNYFFNAATSISDVTFTGFTNLTEVRWKTGYPSVQYDNIVVNPIPSTPPTPEIAILSVNSTITFRIRNLRIGKQYFIQKSYDLVNWTEPEPLPGSFTAFTTLIESITKDFYNRNASQVFYRLRWSE